MKLLGYVFKKTENAQPKKLQALPKDNDLDGAKNLYANGYKQFGLSYDHESIVNENDLILKYREMAEQPEVDKAINCIVNQALTYEEGEQPVKINLDNISEDLLSDKAKEIFDEEFNNILNMMNFKNDGSEIFRKWYIDGRQYYQKVIDMDNPKDGIQELRYIDSLKMKKVREVVNMKPMNENSVLQIEDYVEYFVYNNLNTNMDSGDFTGEKVAADSITFIHSGIFDKSYSLIYSFLHNAMKPLNQLKMMEDAVLIYRLSRSAATRVFNVEVSGLPRGKAEQYLREVMGTYNRKEAYDPMTGELKNNKRIMSMMDNFWFAKRGGNGTTVDQLSEGQNLGNIEDLDYFKNVLRQSLNVPITRYEADNNFNLGKSSEITRDELLFDKFINRLRNRFSGLFLDILKTQLVLKEIITLDEWEKIEDDICFDYLTDSYFTELKNAEILEQRVNTFNTAQDLIEKKYFSKEYIRRKVLHIDDEEWKEMQKQIDIEQEENGEDNMNGDSELSTEENQNMDQPSEENQTTGTDNLSDDDFADLADIIKNL